MNLAKTSRIPFILLLLFVSLSRAGAAEPKLPAWSQITEEVVTPHTKWAKPYYSGKLKVLIISALFSQRETIELAERLDINYTQISIPTHGGVTAFLAPTWDYLREKLEADYEVIILGFTWNAIPEDIRDTILEKVQAGTGFLFVDPQGLDKNLYTIFEKGKITEPDVQLAGSIPFRKLPAFSGFDSAAEFARKYIAESRLENGKICFLKYTSGRGQYLYLTPIGASNFVDFDYYLSLVAKLILKLANKEPSDKIISVEPENNDLVINLKSKEKDLAIVFRVRTPTGDSEYETTTRLDREKMSLPMPQLASGVHFLDLFLKKDGGIVDWRSSFVEVPETCEIKLSLNKDNYLPGEIISGTLSASPSPEGIFNLALEDSLGRIISRQEFPASETLPFSFPAFTPLAVLHKVKACFYQGKRLREEQEKCFPIKVPRNPSDFFFIVWGGLAPEYIQNYKLKLLKDYGIDSVLLYCNDKKTLEKITSFNLSPFPYIWSLKSYTSSKGPVGPIRSPCFSDPNREGAEKGLIQQTKLMAPFAPLGYTLGDENALSGQEEDFCFSDYCLKDLQEYLRKEYGSLESLNGEWETDFSDWSAVRPNTLSELQKRGEKKNFSSWIDHRLHMENVFADIHYFGRKTIEGVDKDAYVGAEGLGLGNGSFNGLDFYKLGAALRSVGGYGGTTLWRAFLPGDSLLWDWELYGRGVTAGCRYPWRMLLSGGNGVGFYALDELSPDYASFNPDYTLAPPFAAVVQGTKTVKAGIGRLLLSGKPEYSPVAILHSQPNLHLSAIFSKQAEKLFNSSYQESLPGFESLLKTLWYYPSFIAHDQVKQGILKDNQYQCLVLPSIHAISKQERAALKEFVKGGGIVIADVLPGFFDGHGKMVAENDLEELFGVKRERWPSNFEAGVTLEGKQLPLQVAEELTLAGGKTSAFSPQGRPAFILNSYGKGKTLCLNILLPSCQNLKEKDRLLFYSLLNLQLASLGVNQLFKVTQEGEIPFFAGTGRYFSSDKNKYLFILPDKDGKVKISLPEKACLYDLLEGKYLGKGKAVETTFDLKQPYLVSMLPYRVTDLKIECPATLKSGEEIRGNVSIISDGNTPGLHVVRIGTYNPEGKLIPYYSFNLLCRQGKGDFSFPLALNEATGIWVIKIKDVATGIKNELSFKVIK